MVQDDFITIRITILSTIEGFSKDGGGSQPQFWTGEPQHKIGAGLAAPILR